jgi:HPt (histidine-containing phosphotransfer) domain-containing protein
LRERYLVYATLSFKKTGITLVGQQIQRIETATNKPVDASLVFDRSHFESATMHDVVLQREILGLFFAQLEQVRERVNLGPISEDDAKFLAHTLRGAASAVGALELEKIGTKWEKQQPNSRDLKLNIAAAEGRLRAAVHSYLI